MLVVGAVVSGVALIGSIASLVNKDRKKKEAEFQKEMEKIKLKKERQKKEEEEKKKKLEKAQETFDKIYSEYNTKDDYEFGSNKNFDTNNSQSIGKKNTNNSNNNEEKYNYKIFKKENDFTTIVTERDRIIGIDKDKMQTLINNRDYQIVEKELSILIKEKDKLEGSLLKMPEHPRKLNDIRTKKEINDIIERIENDISYTRSMLKKTNDYYIKKI